MAWIRAMVASWRAIAAQPTCNLWRNGVNRVGPSPICASSSAGFFRRRLSVRSRQWKVRMAGPQRVWQEPLLIANFIKNDAS
jgi:hypothetical protein